MKKTALICFTERGFQTEKRLAGLLTARGMEARLFVLGKYALQAAAMDHTVSFCPVKEGKLSEWAAKQWETDALIFVGACGIAVRAIAPLIKDKYTDPAVLVVDEAAGFVIPILSGHMGGANELAACLAEPLSAVPVITTATDRNGRFAVDVFARSHGLVIDDRMLAKAVSADVLAGEPVGFFCDFPLDGETPKELSCDTICQHTIWVTVSKRERTGAGAGRVLKLIPRCVAVGIGCKRGTSKEKLHEILTAAMEENHIDERSVCAFASIDLKQGEPGLLALSKELSIPFLTYTGEELLHVPGRFSESEFVRQTTGIGNVCERAAMAACLEVSKSSRILFGKYAKDGVTAAAACFYPDLFKSGDRKEMA